ncbi:MAG: carbohydrate ABC transporter permease [Anaerolineae bacterium]|nr:carbohydrate ABC transporter permease [Anaerolineae bacterium]
MATAITTIRDRYILLGRKTWRFLLYVLVVVLAIVFMFPYFWTIASSFKATSDLYLYPPSMLPETWHPENYVYVFELHPFDLWMRNTVIITVLSTIGTVGSAIICSYAFARLRWPGRDLIFTLTLATLMLPGEVTLVPLFLIFRNLGWLDTWLPLFVPAYFGGGAFDIFLLRQFMRTIPRELDEAAYIDGAGRFRILMTILVPLMKPAIATLTVMHIVYKWSEFMGPLIYLNTSELFPVAVGLRFFEEWGKTVGMAIPQDHYLMGCCVMSTAPIIVLFFLAQNYFVQGIVMSGIKG